MVAAIGTSATAWDCERGSAGASRNGRGSTPRWATCSGRTSVEPTCRWSSAPRPTSLGAVDALWYVRNRSSYLFEVEWTAMLGEAVLRRGSQIPTSDQQARFLVIPAERAELLRLKLSRSPWVRTEIERQNWHVLKWPHLEALVARGGADRVAGADDRARSTRRARRQAADHVRRKAHPRGRADPLPALTTVRIVGSGRPVPPRGTPRYAVRLALRPGRRAGRAGRPTARRTTCMTSST